MALFIGIDIGAAYSKGILRDDDRTLAAYVCPSGGDFRQTAENVRNVLLAQANCRFQDIANTVATGYGSKLVEFAREHITDISCHGKGVFHQFPTARTVVDVGDFNSKAFRLDDQGHLVNFLLSGKCAGGSGRILKITAKVLQLKVGELGALSLASRHRVEINTGCAVFAESEAISRIAEGVAKEDLIAGIHRALAAQVHSLAERLGIEADYAMTGGGARNAGLVRAMEEMSRRPVLVPDDPHMTGALGAAIMAKERS
ncbi:MAG: 2-hydroxyglutaryl-CoA dehydratase [Deltaproteobacteria bacterium]|nr:2-hydroxyglutaryl-CoA dehydratase [Deltaproteobacteria bacterium]